MIQEANKLDYHLGQLKKGMNHKNFKLVTDSSKEIYLQHSKQGYQGYSRIKKTSRLEFMKAVSDSFKEKGIDVILPIKSGIGDTIYFDILGERVGTLYEEKDRVLFKGCEKFSSSHPEEIEKMIEEKIDLYRKTMALEQERIEQNKSKIAELENLLQTPSCIKKDVFRPYRLPEQACCILGNNRFSLFVVSKKDTRFGKMYERWGWILLLSELKKESCQTRIENKIILYRDEMRRCEESEEYSEERYLILETRKKEFELRVMALQQLFKKYHVSFGKP